MSGSASRKKRVRHDIIMEILKLAKKGIKKTDILFKARLSSDMLKKYLNALKEADFITEESGIWKTTEKGFHVIEACEICHRLIKEVP
jgi:predicted transcriptional regulator